MEKEFKAKFTADDSDFQKKSGNVAKKGDWLSGKLKAAAAGVIALFAFDKIVTGIKSLISVNAKFEKSLATLSAITGAAGDDLKFYGQSAREMSKQSTFSAMEVVEAYKLMGSARPELLKNKEALAAVTKEALVLSEASGLDLTTATESLAKAMNQFNVPANEAARVINALAAGSKEGAMEVPEVAEAIKHMGTAAAMANISLESSVAMIEALAEKGFEGSRAGIQLRNVIIKLQSGVDKFNPAVVGMSKALENLAAENLTAAELTERFGLENMQAASTLIENRKRVDELTTAVTGTNTAYEQQSVVLDTLESQWAIFKNTIGDIALEAGGLVDKTKDLVKGLTTVVKGYDAVGETEALGWFGKLVTKIGILTGDQSSLAVMQKILAGEEMKAEQAAAALAETTETLGAATKETAKVVEKQPKTVADYRKEIEKLTTSLESLEVTDTASIGVIRNKIAALQELIDKVTQANDVQNAPVKSIKDIYGDGTTKGLQLLPKAEMIDPMALAHTHISTVIDDLTLAQIAAQSFGEQMMIAGIQGSNSMVEFGKTALMIAKKVIAAYVAEGVAAAVKSALINVPFPFNIAAAGIAGGLAAAAINAAIPEFAMGGGVAGPTLAMVGEAPGISRSNPEYIGTAKQLGLGAGGGTLTTRISRSDLLFILNEGKSYNSNTF